MDAKHAAAAVAAVDLFWLGANFSITGMEAWVKFNAPTITRPAALDVGRHVFSALNVLEVTLAAASVYLWALHSGALPFLGGALATPLGDLSVDPVATASRVSSAASELSAAADAVGAGGVMDSVKQASTSAVASMQGARAWVVLVAPALVAVQSAWLLPSLKERGRLIAVEGVQPPGSGVHRWYAITELAKWGGLIASAGTCLAVLLK